jgi:hypothetical protein
MRREPCKSHPYMVGPLKTTRAVNRRSWRQDSKCKCDTVMLVYF